MSLKPQPISEIPAETVRVVFPKGNVYIHLRDTLGTIYQDELFADLYPDRSNPSGASIAGYVDAELLVASQTEYVVTWWDLPARIIASKPENRLGMPYVISPWSGNTNKHVAHKDTSAAVGRLPKHEAKK